MFIAASRCSKQTNPTPPASVYAPMYAPIRMRIIMYSKTADRNSIIPNTAAVMHQAVIARTRALLASRTRFEYVCVFVHPLRYYSKFQCRAIWCTTTRARSSASTADDAATSMPLVNVCVCLCVRYVMVYPRVCLHAQTYIHTPYLRTCVIERK